MPRFVLPLLLLMVGYCYASPKGFIKGDFIFSKESWHNHASSIVEASNGDLIVCWFHGSGERTADDVKIEGARKRKGEEKWSERFTMADTLGYPDTNCALFIDPQGRLWLLWPTILANRWESALMKYNISTNYFGDGPPVWSTHEVLHVTPGAKFIETVDAWVKKKEAEVKSGRWKLLGSRVDDYLEGIQKQAYDKLTRRLGWMTRAHPVVVKGNRMIVPLYSDGFNFSLMAYTDDWGATWQTSAPLCGDGNIQPSIVEREDGALYTLMRDNGPAPKRLLESISYDQGETWSDVTDTQLPNPGSGAEIIRLKNGHWILIGNDTEKGRGSLAVQISEDAGRTWKWKRHLEFDSALSGTEQYHYPSIIQGKDGTLHATYSYFTGEPAVKTIKYVHFNEEWIRGE